MFFKQLSSILIINLIFDFKTISASVYIDFILNLELLVNNEYKEPFFFHQKNLVYKKNIFFIK